MSREFAGFHLISQLGRGGMGAAWIAEKRGPGGIAVRTCLKRMHPDLLDAAAARAFQHEARLAAMLAHHAIVKVHAIGEEDGQWWMSMELVDGIDLGKLLDFVRARGEPLPTQVIVLIACEVAEALAFAHELTLADGTPAGIVHRDVKPPNILLSADGRVKLTDFGIAKSALAERTKTGWMKGTIAYMSPEQALQSRDIDGRSDLFSLGVVIFEMLAGVRPFDGTNEMTTLLNITDCQRTARLPEGTPPHFRTLVTALLQKDPADRPSSGEDVLHVLAPLSSSSRARRELVALIAEARAAPPSAEPDAAADTDPTLQDPTVRARP